MLSDASHVCYADNFQSTHLLIPRAAARFYYFILLDSHIDQLQLLLIQELKRSLNLSPELSQT